MIIFKSFIFATICLFFSIPVFGKNNPLPTFFTYSLQDIEAVERLTSNFPIKKQDLQKWDQVTRECIQQASITPLVAGRLYTYLYVAQTEFAYLSHNIKGEFVGTLDPLNGAILRIFIENCKLPDFISDAYSDELSRLVTKKIKERISKEDAQPYKFEVPKEKQAIYNVGLDAAKWIPWYITPVQNYWPPSPPPFEDPMWKDQIKKIREMQTHLDERKKEMIHYWAATFNADDGDWRIIANQYLFSHDIPLLTTLQVRSLLMIGLYDGLIVGLSAKYHFLSKRPQEFDPTSHYEIPVPKHPSYPANHALIASVAASILSHFFPQESAYWEGLADQAGASRIWAGIHYPIDITQGQEMGKKIAQRILQKEPAPR